METKLLLQIIIELMTKDLGRAPTSAELIKELNGIGLIIWAEKIKRAS